MVLAVGNGEEPGSIEDFTHRRFAGDGQETRALRADRIRETVDSLNEGNHIAYGISREQFARYEAAALAATLPSP
jgi:hypothetical protein